MQWEKIAILLEFTSYLFVTPTIYGKRNLTRMKTLSDSFFEKVDNFIKTDITLGIKESKGTWLIISFILWLSISSYLAWKFYYFALVLSLLFGFIPLLVFILITFSGSKKHHNYWLLYLYQILLSPVKLLLGSLSVIVKGLEILMDSLLGIPLFVLKRGGGEYLALIIGTLLFVISKAISFCTCCDK